MDAIWSALWVSFKVASCATVLSVLLAVPLAYGLARWRFSGKSLIETLLTLPLVLPPTVLGYYLLVIFGRQGWIGQYLDFLGIQLIFTWQGASLAASIVIFPLILKPSRAAFEAIDTNLENAARVLGLSRIPIFFRVSLPLAMPQILSASLLGFARALGEFGATLMVAGSIPDKTQTISTAIYEAVQSGNDAQAHTLVYVSCAMCMIILSLASWVSHRYFISMKKT